MNVSYPVVLQQLAYRLPVLVTCLVGFILSLLFWRRAPRPCLLVLLGTSLAAVVSISYTLALQYVIHSYQGANRGAAIELLGVLSSVLAAAPYALLLGAAFVGRSVDRGPAFPVAFPHGTPTPYRPA